MFLLNLNYLKLPSERHPGALLAKETETLTSRAEFAGIENCSTRKTSHGERLLREDGHRFKAVRKAL